MSHVLYPTTNLSATEQLIIERADGAFVYDNRGRRYLEAMSGLWCTALGYGNEELIEAATEQMRALSFSHMFGGKSHQVGMDLAEKLSSIVPVDNAYVFFGSSGSDANDSHIKLLRYYFNAIGKPEKRKIIARDKGYHGLTWAASALTGLGGCHTHFDPPFEAVGVIRADSPHYYRNGLADESESVFCDRLVANLEALIAREGAESIAAFIAEPVTGAGGVVVPPADYWPRVQEVLRKNDILLIDDEVICGFGRTGNDFGATTFEIKPDMMTLAKALTSAYLPLSAAVISGTLYDAMVEPSTRVGSFGHGYTYSGHPTSCAVALKALEIYERDNIYARAAKTGAYLQKRLRELASHPLVGEVRGVGMIAALELVADKAQKTPFETNIAAATVQQAAQDNGVIVRALGGNNIAVCPPLIIGEPEVDEIVDTLGVALRIAEQKL